MNGLALVVRHILRPGHEDAFDALASRTLESIAASEPGTLVYAVHTVADQPLQRVFYELYIDRSAFEAHEAYPHMREFLTERLAHIESVDVELLDATAAHAVRTS
ncbi:MAG: antibiotic biosynthesis monooxygenase [Cellulomonas sp.]|nr:antibiotic biosynthesis monooxygenase [Cellulomonas sp.]